MSNKSKKVLTTRRKREWGAGLLFVSPSVIAMACMVAYPLVLVLIYSFCKVALPKFDLKYIGFENIRKVLTSSQLPIVLKNTILWTFVSLFIRFVLGFASALILQVDFKGKTLFRIITLLPWTMPSIVAANLWRWIYNPDTGILNFLVKQINPAAATNWLGNSSTALMAVIISYSWMGFPYLMLMIVAGLQGIPKEYTEAARIDGANSIQVFFRITLPQLKGFLLILTLLEIISGFNSFDLIFTMTGGGPGVATETVGLNIYRMAFQNYDFGKASSMGILLLVLVMIVFGVYSLGQRRKARRWQG